MKKKTHEQFLKDMATRPYGDEYEIKGTYTGSHDKISVRHLPCGHQFEVNPTSLLARRCCPYCGKRRLKYTIEEAKKIFDDADFTLLSDVYTDVYTKMDAICKRHPDAGVMKVALFNVLYERSGCKRCKEEHQREAMLKRTSIEDVRSKLLAKHIKLLDTEYLGEKHDYRCKCLIHTDIPEFGVNLDRFIHANGYGCPACAYEAVQRAHRTDESDIKHLVVSLGYEYVGTDFNNRSAGRTVVRYLCPHHREQGILSKPLGKFRVGGGCPFCMHSRGERLVAAWLNNHDAVYEPQKKFQGLYGTGGGLLSYDFYIPQSRVLIEFQGRQHYESIDYFHQDEQRLAIQQEHDRRKREYALKHGYKLVEIVFSEIDSIDAILSASVLEVA